MKTQQTLLLTDALKNFVKRLLPDQAGLQVDRLVFAPNVLILLTRSLSKQGSCPLCGQPSTRVHSLYWRILQDLPWGTWGVRLRVRVRCFVCTAPSCPRKIFTQRLGPLAEPSARRTSRLRQALLALGWALGGEAGARKAVARQMPVGAATLLSFMRRFGGMALPTPRVLGVNDWSFQHDQPTGTILVDLERHQPVDLLLGNDEQVLDRWHFIVRRIGAYSIPFEERRG